MKKISLLFAFIILALSSNFSQTASPKLINTVPQFGDCNVDTSLKVIQFEFDKDMSSGYSFPDCPNMIPINGNATWKTKRILELPVKLKPNSFYRADLNSSYFRNFASEDGTPLNPDYFLLRTKNYNDSSIIDTSLNMTNYEKFCDYFLKHYSYKDLYGIDWKGEFNSLKDDINLSRSNSEFGIKLLKVLKKANDIHLSIDIDNQNYSCATFRLVPVSYNYGTVFSQLMDLQISENNVGFTGMVGNACYVLISSLASWYAQDISFTIEQIKQMKDLPFLILDLRLNRGGDEQLASSFVSMIISDTIAYEKISLYNQATGQFDNIFTKHVAPDNASIKYKGKIFVMISGNVVSSAESFVLMLKQLPNVQLIGNKTYGASGNPQAFKITDSITVYIPSWLAYDMNDKLIEGNGIQPNVKLEFPENDYAENDPLFEYVLDTIECLPFISIAPKVLRILDNGSATSFVVTSNTNWKLVCDQPWLTVQSADYSDSDTVIISASINCSSLSRTASITVTGEGVLDKIINVTQNGAAPVLKVSTNNLTFEALANCTDTFNIVSNVNWKVKSNQPWIICNMESGSDSAIIIVTASENLTGRPRSAIILVSGNWVLPEYISINQAASTVTRKNEISSPNKVLAYPNPTAGQLEISGIKPFEGEDRIEVSNYLGSVVLLRYQINGATVQLDFSDYPSGLYLISIYSGNEIYQTKVIKNVD